MPWIPSLMLTLVLIVLASNCTSAAVISRSSSAVVLRGYSRNETSTEHTLKQHPTAEEACEDCKEQHPDEVCYYKDCDDGTGAICWSPHGGEGFTLCHCLYD
eukprot:gnl/TRDRNA2_/TRDRNA2_185627_c0_seq1.p1 gnl/TRDRNA2_/TRDRNA2_185627_c0~~gnl/TRDRNA2_/TRDRNA2_185627_c0_seq1.p1  ORF type:complete len:102 (-),score=15.98 gnl/TRDRNA2_/TRDRNA2_185627_c0_seq1:174-479(-)